MKTRQKRTETVRLACLWVGVVLAPLTGQCFYSPSTGSWLSRDPLQEDGGKNLYGLVGNGPITSIDPVGLFDMYVHRDAWGHAGVRDNGGVNYDYGRYRGTYSGGGGLQPGPNILVRSRGWPPQDKLHSFTLYHFSVRPELDAAMNDSLKDQVAGGTSTWPPAVLARFTTPPAPLSADALYMGTDWSLTDNCATFTQGRLNDAIWRVLHNPKSSELAKQQARELQEDSIPGAKAPGPVEDELDLMARQHPDLVKKIPLPANKQTNVQKLDNPDNSNSGSCGCRS